MILITYEELAKARQLGSQLREAGINPLDFIHQTDDPQSVKNKKMGNAPKAQDGLEVKQAGEQLPQLEILGIKIPRKIFGIDVGTQAAEKFSGSTEEEDVFDPKRHKMKPDQVRELIKQVSIKGMMMNKPDKDILETINQVVAQAGYTNDELSPEKVKAKAIKGYELYNTDQPNPFPAWKLISSIIGGTTGNIVGGRTGAMVGARVGAIGGPWGMIAGSIVGGTLGYVGALLGYEQTLTNLNKKGMLYTPTYNEVGEFIGNVQGINRPTKEKLVEYLKHEAKIDAMFQGGFFAARPVFKALGMGLSNIALGVGKNERAMAKAIKETTGISPSIVDISRYDIIRAAPTVIGRLPFFRRPFVKAAAAQKEALLQTAKNKIFLDGPTFSLAEIGHDMSKVRDTVTKKIVDNVSKKYDDFYAAIGDNPAIAWHTTRAKAVEGLKFMEQLGIPPQELMRNSFYQKLANLAGKENMTVFGAGAPFTAAQWKQQRTMFTQEILNNPTLTPEMKDIGRNVLRGLEEDMASLIKGNPNLYKNADKLLNEADKSFKNMMILFGDPTIKELGKDSKFAYINMLQQPGSKYSSELLDSVLKDFRDPIAMERLHNILGDQMFGKVMKAKVLDAFQNAFTKSTTKPGLTNINEDFFKSFDDLSFDSNAFKNALGLNEVGLPLKRRLDTLIKGLQLGSRETKLPSAQELLNFADAAQTFFNGKNMNISTFLTRRAALGGVESLLRVITPAAAIGGGYSAAMASPMSTLLGVGAMYYSGHILARPMLVESFKEAFERWGKANAVAGTGAYQKALEAATVASQRAIRELFRSDTDIPDELDNRFSNIQGRMQYLNMGEEAFNEMKAMTEENLDKDISDILGQDSEQKLERGMIMPGVQPGVTSIPDQSENIKKINTPVVDTPNVVNQNSLSVRNNVVNNPNNIINRGVSTTNPMFTAGMKPVNNKINQNSRLALAGNDPLLQAIARRNV